MDLHPHPTARDLHRSTGQALHPHPSIVVDPLHRGTDQASNRRRQSTSVLVLLPICMDRHQVTDPLDPRQIISMRYLRIEEWLPHPIPWMDLAPLFVLVLRLSTGSPVQWCHLPMLDMVIPA
jgi:hypothetical protein